MGNISSLFPGLGAPRVMTGETDIHLFSEQHGVAGAGMRVVATGAPRSATRSMREGRRPHFFHLVGMALTAQLGLLLEQPKRVIGICCGVAGGTCSGFERWMD